MKLLADTNIKPTWLNRHLYHYDPDLLLEPVNTHQFSNIISDIYINGTWKKTSSGRLIQTEQLVARHYKNNNNLCLVLDVGASDGSTSVDLLNYLQKHLGANIKIYLAERYLNLSRYYRYGFYEYRLSDGKPVMLKIWKFAIRLPRSEHRYAFISNFLSFIYLQFKSFRTKMVKTADIPLYQKRILNEKNIEIMEFDCLKPDIPEGLKFDVVRASNILNLAYFSPGQIRTFLHFINKSLTNDGLLVVSRNTDDGRNQEKASIWKKEDNGFRLLESVHGGSEIEYIVSAVG